MELTTLGALVTGGIDADRPVRAGSPWYTGQSAGAAPVPPPDALAAADGAALTVAKEAECRLYTIDRAAHPRLAGRAGLCWPCGFAALGLCGFGALRLCGPSGRTRAESARQNGTVAHHPIARHLLRAKDLADARYFEPLSVADLAAAAGLSPAHFSRRFKAAFGESPHQYLLTRRLERAAALLRATDWTVADICFAVGGQSVGSFTVSFHRVFGMSPLAYRAAYPPAEQHLRIPRCVALAYGRPKHRTFREDRAQPASIALT
jgi:AraC-like DNA-binding protein